MTDAARHNRRLRARRLILVIAALGVVAALVLSYRSTNEAVLAAFTPEDTQFDQAATTVAAPRIAVVKENGNGADLAAQRGGQRQSESGFSGEALAGAFTFNGATWQMSADFGIAPPGFDRVKVRDNVYAVNENDLSVNTDSATIFLDDNRVIADQAINVASDKLTLQAGRAEMTGEDGARVITFAGGVSGKIMLSSDAFLPNNVATAGQATLE